MTHTRRGLLAGGASLVLAGCGASPEVDDGSPGESETGRRADAEVLNAALEEKLRAERKHDPRSPSGTAERAHVERLRKEIEALGGTPVAAVDDSDEGGPAAIAKREQWTIAAIQDLLPKLSDRDLRSLLARMMVVDAEQLAVIRRELDEPPAPDALLVVEAPA